MAGSVLAALPLLDLRDHPGGTDISGCLPDRFDRTMCGEGTRRKSLGRGEASLLARVLVGEVARRPDTEVRAVIGVVLNRRQRAPNRSLTDVLFHEKNGVWAFTALDPVRANPELVWGPGVTRSLEYRRMRRLIDETWQAGVNHTFTHYWHPDAMKPKGATPRWARGRTPTRIGAALFLTINEGG